MARGYRFGVVGSISTVPNGKTVLPTDDITIWLKCASIKDKAYTTLAQVLADSTTLQSLISSNNAVDYMVRSTTWASGVTADSGAMTLIGANNYASNTLLGNSTWLNAICNSTYFESVLNAKVPIMTSNTTPSGECFGTSAFASTFEAYKAFDSNNGTWSKFNASSISNAIGYDFGYNVAVCKAVIIPYYAITSARIQTSSDNITWNDISEAIGTTKDVDNIMISNSYAKNRYWRLYLTNSTASNFFIREIQFYGRQNV